jgi:hypothetical protein
LMPGDETGVSRLIVALEHAGNELRIGGIIHEGRFGPELVGGFGASRATSK